MKGFSPPSALSFLRGVCPCSSQNACHSSNARGREGCIAVRRQSSGETGANGDAAFLANGTRPSMTKRCRAPFSPLPPHSKNLADLRSARRNNSQ